MKWTAFRWRTAFWFCLFPLAGSLPSCGHNDCEVPERYLADGRYIMLDDPGSVDAGFVLDSHAIEVIDGDIWLSYVSDDGVAHVLQMRLID